jgi:hypothetical protein
MTALCEECLEKLPAQRPGGGRRRRFCSARCRQIARRRRLQDEQEPLTGAGPRLTNAEIDRACQEELAALSKDPEEALAETLGLMLWAIGNFRKIGGQVRPQLRWRCKEMAAHIDAGLTSYFRP